MFNLWGCFIAIFDWLFFTTVLKTIFFFLEIIYLKKNNITGVYIQMLKDVKYAVIESLE